MSAAELSQMLLQSAMARSSHVADAMADLILDSHATDVVKLTLLSLLVKYQDRYFEDGFMTRERAQEGCDLAASNMLDLALHSLPTEGSA